MDVPTIMPVLQWLGIAMPTMYAGEHLLSTRRCAHGR